MGGFYGSIHIKTTDTESVRIALGTLAFDGGINFLLAPAINGWVTVFPEGSGQDVSVTAKLAATIQHPMLHCLVHDDDVFIYEFYQGGKHVDSYNSCPDYFGGDETEHGGTLEGFDAILPDADDRKLLRELLDEEGFTFEVERLERFADLLGLPNALASYEYLQEGEQDDVEQWEDFVHVPDLPEE